MNFQYQLGPDDHVAFSRHLSRPDGEAVKRLRANRLLLPAVGVAATIPSLVLRHALTGADWLFLLVGLGWFLLQPRIFANGLARRLRAMAKSGMPRGAIGFHELVVDEHGIADRTPFGSHQRNWSGIEEVVETSDHLFVMFGENEAFVVPKSWLGESVVELRDALTAGRSGSTVA
jgi:hypothetical protein